MSRIQELSFPWLEILVQIRDKLILIMGHASVEVSNYETKQ